MSATTVHVVAMGPEQFGVQVTEGDITTSHEVTVPTDVLDEAGIAAAEDDADGLGERVVRETFAFLLEREPATAILRTFSLHDVARYFPEFFGELKSRMGVAS
jgi:hypothetical protein